MASRLSNWLKLLDDASYLKACCPKIKILAYEPRSYPLSRIKVLCNSHFAFIPINCWKKLRSSPLPPLLSNQSTCMVTSLYCIRWTLESLPGFVGYAAFLGLLLPLKTRVWVGSEVISCPCLLCWGLVSGHIGMGNIFYGLEIKICVCEVRVFLGGELVFCFLFCDILVPKVYYFPNHLIAESWRIQRQLPYQQCLKMHVAKWWEILNLLFFGSMRN